MENIILVIHLSVVIAMVLVILIQRTNSDGLSGLGGGSSNGNALFSVRGKANILTKATSFLAVAFLLTSLTLSYIASHRASQSVIDTIKPAPLSINKDDFNAPAGKKEVPAAPAKASTPEVPLAK